MVPGHAGDEPPGWYIEDSGSGMIYKRGRLLGQGTFGRCYRVTEVTSGRVYALKVVPRAGLAAVGTGDRVHGPDRPPPVRGVPAAGAVPAHPGGSVPAAPPALPPGPGPPRPHAGPRPCSTARPAGRAGPPLLHPEEQLPRQDPSQANIGGGKPLLVLGTV
ncbi:translation initiation factor IF-2-like [Manacus candei]|uniref:translation initiation factor IF-2-like n=1 Tax=Manacus candei TaxID=415023 RepID=UPI002227108C|nr:translation initiation factor IF-2-like [Manacus candei]